MRASLARARPARRPSTSRAKPAVPPPRAALLSISLVGAVCAWGRGKSAELGLRKAVAALGYLCLQDRMTTTRERLAYLLWSDSDEQKARASLRQTLSALRRAFSSVGFNGLTTDKLNVHLQ